MVITDFLICNYSPTLALRLRAAQSWCWVLPYLELGFPLRCFQRLSYPNVATEQCSWRNSSYTRGSFFPVLSSRYFPNFLERRLYLHPSLQKTKRWCWRITPSLLSDSAEAGSNFPEKKESVQLTVKLKQVVTGSNLGFYTNQFSFSFSW